MFAPGRPQSRVKVNASQDVAEDTAAGRLTEGSGSGNPIVLGSTQAPRRDYRDRWRYANGDPGRTFQSLGSAVAEAAVRPFPAGVADAYVRAQADAKCAPCG